MTVSHPFQDSRFLPKLRWNENSLLGKACFAYNKEHSKPEHWTHSSNSLNRHAASMRAALIELGYDPSELNLYEARIIHHDRD